MRFANDDQSKHIAIAQTFNVPNLDNFEEV